MTSIKAVRLKRERQRQTDIQTALAMLERGTRPQSMKRYWGGSEWAIARLLFGSNNRVRNWLNKIPKKLSDGSSQNEH